MKQLIGTGEVPVIYSAHHASHKFGEFTSRVALSHEQKVRFSDYGTDHTVPLNGIATLIAERSRALGDLNRNPDDLGRFQQQDYGKKPDGVTPDRHDIWLPGRELTDEDKEYCQQQFYNPYHQRIVDILRAQDRPTFVMAWDNTAHYVIGQDNDGNDVIMPPFILSNRGQQESTLALEGEETSCDPDFLSYLVDYFRQALQDGGLPDEVHTNLVYKGGHITRTYSTRRNPALLASKGIKAHIESLQLEYDTALTHDQKTLEFYPERAEKLRYAFSLAMALTFRELDI